MDKTTGIVMIVCIIDNLKMIILRILSYYIKDKIGVRSLSQISLDFFSKGYQVSFL